VRTQVYRNTDIVRKAVKCRKIKIDRSEPTLTKIRDLVTTDIPATLTLNNAHAKETSLLSAASLETLIGMAFYARGIDQGASAFLIAFDQDAAYDNPNFNWFKQRRDTFVYIVRIIVADSMRGQGIARRLYQDLFAEALKAGQQRVVCEVNLDPPNPASDAFHESMDFVEVGQATIRNGAKTVRYFEKILR